MLGVADWNSGSETMPIERLFEYTESRIVDNYESNNVPRIDQLIKLPCLFMNEGFNDELAYVGQINRARVVGRSIVFEFTLDSDVPPIKNSLIYANKLALDMSVDFEFHRSHWAVKDVDLYRFLFRNIRHRRQMPNVFQISEHDRIELNLASVMMPFDQGFTNVFNSISKAAANLGLDCKRADNIWEHATIIQDIVSLIDKSRIVVCDCTGRNPNVFYEAGIAHTLGREVILITQNEQDIPFDLRHLRYIRYLNNTQGLGELELALQGRIRTILS